MTPSPFEEPWRYSETEADMMRMVAKALHQPTTSKRAIVGEHAFQHASGIHQEAITGQTEKIRAQIFKPSDSPF